MSRCKNLHGIHSDNLYFPHNQATALKLSEIRTENNYYKCKYTCMTVCKLVIKQSSVNENQNGSKVVL
jgi:hypothetical protein